MHVDRDTQELVPPQNNCSFEQSLDLCGLLMASCHICTCWHTQLTAPLPLPQPATAGLGRDHSRKLQMLYKQCVTEHGRLVKLMRISH